MSECVVCRKDHDGHKSFYRWMAAPGVPQPNECPMPPPIEDGTGWVEWPAPMAEASILRPVPLWMVDLPPPPPRRYGPVCAKHQQRWLDSLSRTMGER